MAMLHYNVVIFTSPVDVESIAMRDDYQQAVQLFDAVSRISPYMVTLYRYDGPAWECIRRHHPSFDRSHPDPYARPAERPGSRSPIGW